MCFDSQRHRKAVLSAFGAGSSKRSRGRAPAFPDSPHLIELGCRKFAPRTGAECALRQFPFLETANEASELLQRLAESQRQIRPGSAYRLQFNQSFRFTDGIRLIPYLQRLGITTLYSSPILAARSGSTHGYDITDHNRINPEIGSEEELQQLLDLLRRSGMGLLLDVVPNHMGVGYGTNPWWQDVLENGRASEYANFFDIDWNPLKPELRNKVLLPILGNQYGAELEAGHIVLAYGDRRFPDRVFRQGPSSRSADDSTDFPLRGRAAPTGGDGSRAACAVWRHLRSCRRTPLPNRSGASRRQREVPFLLRRFADLVERSEEARDYVQAAVARLNGTAGRFAQL